MIADTKKQRKKPNRKRRRKQKKRRNTHTHTHHNKPHHTTNACDTCIYAAIVEPSAEPPGRHRLLLRQLATCLVGQRCGGIAHVPTHVTIWLVHQSMCSRATEMGLWRPVMPRLHSHHLFRESIGHFSAGTVTVRSRRIAAPTTSQTPTAKTCAVGTKANACAKQQTRTHTKKTQHNENQQDEENTELPSKRFNQQHSTKRRTYSRTA